MKCGKEYLDLEYGTSTRNITRNIVKLCNDPPYARKVLCFARYLGLGLGEESYKTILFPVGVVFPRMQKGPLPRWKTMLCFENIVCLLPRGH